jgi:ABC-type nitrate/sulfonate/bicarbonate transport system substrate-binding protein
LLILLLGLTNSVAAQTGKVTVAYSGISADQLVIWVDRDAGSFAKNNLDVQAVYFSGGTISVTAMIAGDTPIIQASGPGIVSAGLAGADPVYVVGGITTGLLADDSAGNKDAGAIQRRHRRGRAIWRRDGFCRALRLAALRPRAW